MSRARAPPVKLFQCRVSHLGTAAALDGLFLRLEGHKAVAETGDVLRSRSQLSLRKPRPLAEELGCLVCFFNSTIAPDTTTTPPARFYSWMTQHLQRCRWMDSCVKNCMESIRLMCWVWWLDFLIVCFLNVTAECVLLRPAAVCPRQLVE